MDGNQRHPTYNVRTFSLHIFFATSHNFRKQPVNWNQIHFCILFLFMILVCPAPAADNSTRPYIWINQQRKWNFGKKYKTNWRNLLDELLRQRSVSGREGFWINGAARWAIFRTSSHFCYFYSISGAATVCNQFPFLAWVDFWQEGERESWPTPDMFSTFLDPPPSKKDWWFSDSDSDLIGCSPSFCPSAFFLSRRVALLNLKESYLRCNCTLWCHLL